MVGQGELTGELWIVYRWRHRDPPYDVLTRAKRIDNDVCPMIIANGIAGIPHHRYYLTDRPPPGAIITPSRG